MSESPWCPDLVDLAKEWVEEWGCFPVEASRCGVLIGRQLSQTAQKAVLQLPDLSFSGFCFWRS